MAHEIDGFTASFTHRGSWKADLYEGEEYLGPVPVTWRKGTYRKPGTDGLHQTVWFQNIAELEAARLSSEPFLVIVAEATDNNSFPHQIKHMNAVFRVVATGESTEDRTIECRVLERVKAR
jgi:hypothetical protein